MLSLFEVLTVHEIQHRSGLSSLCYMHYITDALSRTLSPSHIMPVGKLLITCIATPHINLQ